MFTRPVHTYRASAQHNGIGVEARGYSATDALDKLVERYGQNRKGDDLNALTYVRRLANNVLHEKRGRRGWSGTTVSEGRSFVRLVRI